MFSVIYIVIVPFITLQRFIVYPSVDVIKRLSCFVTLIRLRRVRNELGTDF